MQTIDNTFQNQLSKTRDGLTGRDGFIIRQALYEFIRTQQALPDFEVQWSNVRDAQRILLAFPSAGEPFATTDAAVGRKPANLTIDLFA